MQKKILVSIVTPTYNSLSYIGDTYISLKSQSHDCWEWLVTDDSSTDGTYEWLCELAKVEPRLKLYRNRKNSGAAVSRNNSLALAKGKYIAFLDSDDTWRPDKLFEQLKIMDTGINFSFTSYRVVRENNEFTGVVVDRRNLGPYSYKDMLKKKATIGCSTVMVSAELASGKKMPNIRTGQDYAFWLELLRSNVVAYLITVPLTDYRVSPNSISRNKLKKCMRQWMIYRDLESLGLFPSIYCFFFYAVRVIWRR